MSTISLDGLIADLRRKDFQLPSLPDVATRVKKAAEDPHTSIDQLTQLIRMDPALAGHIVQAANSTMFAGLPRVHNIGTAVGRLGFTCVRNLVLSMSVIQVFKYGHFEQFKYKVRDTWKTSTYVGAIAEVLARRHTKLDSTQALLAGLTHNIGVLPILNRLWQDPEAWKDDQSLRVLLRELQGELGSWILQQWNFHKDLVDVPRESVNWTRQGGSEVSYSDVVQVALLHFSLGNKDSTWRFIKWEEVEAFKRLNLSPKESIEAMREAKQEIQNNVGLLRGSAR